MSDQYTEERHEDVMQVNPDATTPENDEVLGGNLLNIEHIRNPIHKQMIRAFSDYIDDNRAKFKKEVEITEHDPVTGIHNVVINYFTPELQGASLVNINSFLYELTDIDTIITFEPKFNATIAALRDDDNKVDWMAKGERFIRIALKFNGLTPVHGLAIAFSDGPGKEYTATISCYNVQNQIISQIMGYKSSRNTTLKQFIGFTNMVDNVDKMTIDIDVVGAGEDDIREIMLRNVNVFSFMNIPLLKSMANSNILEFQEFENPMFIKEDISLNTITSPSRLETED